MIRVGLGTDRHRLVEGRALILGGVRIESPLGALGHSDADALCHAVTDALLGAAALGDIGTHFPDHDPRFKGADSLALLREAVRILRQAGFRPVNLDAVVHLERPKLGPMKAEMGRRLAEALGLPAERVQVKAKSGEGIGDVGSGQVVEALAVVLVEDGS